MPMGEEIPLIRGHQIGVPLVLNRYFTPINWFSVKTVADRHRLAAIITSTVDELFGVPTSMTLNDLEPTK